MKIYLPLMARPFFQKLNLLKFQTTLRAMGYNNCCDPSKTGELKFLKAFAKTNPSFCIDIGANVGKYSKLLLDHTESKILAFEPLPGAYLHLEDLSLAYPRRFTAVNTGIGNQNQIMVLHHGSDTSELSSFSADINAIPYVGKSNVNKIDVPVITLDSYFSKVENHGVAEIDLIKIDTEGFEYEVLKGSTQTILNMSPKFIQIEFNTHQLHRGHTLYEISKMLSNYEIFQLLPFGKGGTKRNPVSSETNIFAYSNFIFARKDLNFKF
jgi:FkbM family methyltransferase